MRSMALFWLALSTVTICVPSKFLLVRVDSKQFGDHKWGELVESGFAKLLPSSRGIDNYEYIPEMIKNLKY